MNIIERIAYGAGRVSGLYRQGINEVVKQFPSLGDKTAWMDPVLWGPGLLEGRKPRSKAEMIEQFVSWVYTCVSLNAKSVAAIPLRLYVQKTTKTQKFKTIETKEVNKAQRKWLEANTGLIPYFRKAADIEEVTEHAFLDLMQNVNPFNNQFDLWETTSDFLDLTGEAYWYLPRNKANAPAEIWVIPSPYIRAIPGKTLNEFIASYHYDRGAAQKDLTTDEVVYFSYPNPKNQYRGFSCVQGVADAIYINTKMYEFESGLFENRARVGGIVTMEGNVSEEVANRYEKQFKEKYAGAKKTGKTMVLTGGVKFIPDAMTPQELSYIEGRKLIREEICAAFDVPVSALVATDVNRANAETADYRHAKNGILPRLRRIEQKLNEKLLPMFDPRLFVAFDNPVPEDREFKLKKNDTYVKDNIVTINEIRQDEGKESVGWGDSAWFPFNFMPVNDSEPQPLPSAQATAMMDQIWAEIKERLG